MHMYDVIIVGTGAGGGTLARSLAPSGKRILLLERGDWLPREPANWLAQDVFVDNKYVSPDTWYDEKGAPVQPQVHYFVGGATKPYGPALEHSNVTLLTNAKAVRLETNDAGTAVTGVTVEREGETERFAGEIVVLACGAANTAALLLSSASDKHPNGLANGSDQVGRNYMFHASQAVLALSREENHTVFQKTLGLNDFYFGSDDHDYPLGHIQMVGKSQAPMFHGEKPMETRLAPGWSLEKIAKHAIDFSLSTEDLPLPQNRVTVDGEGRLTLAYKATNDVPKQELYRKLKSILGQLRMEPDHLFGRFAYMKNQIPVAGCAHQAGTCRFGPDPATSVLDVDCKAHELDNLYVVDTSVFPSIGAGNPALTAMANALRVGDHLLERLGAPAAVRAKVGA